MSKKRKNSNYKISFDPQSKGISKKGIALTLTIAILVSAILVVGVICLLNSGGSDIEEGGASLSVPDFTVYDPEGKTVKLSDFAGKPIVLNFWATWCYYCVAEMPEFEKMYDKYGDDVVFLMVNATDNVEETVESATDFYNERGYSFPIYFDKSNDACLAYNVSSLPMTVFITRDGEISYKQTGMISGEALEMRIENILK